MKFRLLNIFFILIVFIANTIYGDEKLTIEVSGKVVKKYYDAPSIVKNPPYGWYLDLDSNSTQYLHSIYKQLQSNDINWISDFDLNSVQLIAYCDEAVQKCRTSEGKRVWVKGEMSNPPFCLSPMRCYQLDLGYDLNMKELEQESTIEGVAKPLPSQGFLVVEECCDLSSITNSYSYHADVDNLNDIPLELPDGALEILTSLKGKLIFRLFPSQPEYCSIERGDNPCYCWFLQMDEPSFQRASSTPVCGPGNSLKNILEQNNWFEVQLVFDKEIQDFCCEHINQEVFVEGFLFHAHTGHHHAPFVMDVKTMY